MTRHISALIWDVDGTLADTIALCVDALSLAITSHGGPDLEPDEIVARFGPTEEGLLRNEVGERWVDAIDTYLVEYKRGHDGLGFDKVCSLVRELSDARVPMAVVTGKGERSAQITLDEIGLGGIFDVVAAGSMHGPIKSEEIARIVTTWGLEPSEVAYVGDAPSDISASRVAGVVAVSAAWKDNAPVDSLAAMRPDVLLKSEDELLVWTDKVVLRPTSSQP